MKRVLFCLSLTLIVYVLTFVINMPDYDLWARLAVGSIFFQTGNVLKHDIFSYLPTKDIWVDHEWGSGVVFYFLAKYMGEWGIFAFKAAIILGIFVLIIKTIKLQKKEAGIFYLTFLGFSLIPGIANLIRCQMFTYLFFTLWIYLLERVRKGENRLIWVFPATMLLWVNMHGGFLSGIGLVIIYAIGEMFNRKSFLKYFGILALILPVTLINPYGLKFWNYIIEAATMPRPYITEWYPISLSGPMHTISGIKVHILIGFMIFALMTVITGIKLLFHRTKPDWTKIILVIVLLYFGIRHQRHTEFFLLAAGGLFYHQYVNLFSFIDGSIREKLADNAYKIWGIIKYSFGYLLLLSICMYLMPKLSNTMLLKSSAYPVGSLEFIKQNNIAGNLATTYGWGGYAFWKLYPQCKVLIDGRYEEVYSNDMYTKAMQFSEHMGDWQEPLRDFHADILVLPKSSYALEDILSLTDWKAVYEDMSSVVLLPKDKIRDIYTYPNYNNPIYLKEDLAMKINLK